MKLCTKCETEKSEDNFRWRNKNKGKRAPWCKECFNAFERENYASNAKRRSDIRETQKRNVRRNMLHVLGYLKKRRCTDCETTDWRILEFDHVRGTKISNISDMVRRGAALKRIDTEIEKCEVVCANCHRIRTIVQFGWYKSVVSVAGFEPANLPDPNGAL